MMGKLQVLVLGFPELEMGISEFRFALQKVLKFVSTFDATVQNRKWGFLN